MRNYPTDKYDLKELARLNAPQWTVDQLKLNPAYNCWGPHEDYMMNKDGGWGAPVLNVGWEHKPGIPSGPPGLDDLNEVVNFYFEVERESKECVACDQGGYNPATKQISDNFYNYSSSTGKGWHDQITQDEVQALVDAGRLRVWDTNINTWSEPNPIPTAAEVNSQQGGFLRGSHDAINRGILIKARATRLGVYGLCHKCEGYGYVYTQPEAQLNLILWLLHPRKGCSRGWEIKCIKKNDLPEVYAFLREAAQRNADRFNKIPKE
jgi:hypothetical protein